MRLSGIEPEARHSILSLRSRYNELGRYFLVGLSGLEPETSSLSVTRSNQLSYSPSRKYRRFFNVLRFATRRIISDALFRGPRKACFVGR